MKYTYASAQTGSFLAGRHRQRRWYLTLAVAVVLPVAAGCTIGGAGPGGTGGTTQITVAAMPGVDTAPLYIAKNDGAFAKAGLNVTIKQSASVSGELSALNSGQVSIAEGDYVDYFYQMARHGFGNLRIIADGYHAAPGVMEILAAPGSHIMTASDLVGKKVGTSLAQVIKYAKGLPYSLETLVAQAALKSDGVDPTQITWVPMAASNLITALQTRQVSAILVQEPYITEAESQLGASPVLDASSGTTANLPLFGYFTSAAFAKMHSQALSAFRSVLEQAQAAAVVPGPIRAELAASGMTMQTASLLTIGAYPTTLDAGSLQRVADIMFTFKGMFPNTALVISTKLAS